MARGDPIKSLDERHELASGMPGTDETENEFCPLFIIFLIFDHHHTPVKTNAGFKELIIEFFSKKPFFPYKRRIVRCVHLQ